MIYYAACWGRSSAGRASGSQSGGREFNPLRLHQRRYRQVVKTPPFHGGFVGSNPASVTEYFESRRTQAVFLFCRPFKQRLINHSPLQGSQNQIRYRHQYFESRRTQAVFRSRTFYLPPLKNYFTISAKFLKIALKINVNKSVRMS